jgi:hypothetical protein
MVAQVPDIMDMLSSGLDNVELLVSVLDTKPILRYRKKFDTFLKQRKFDGARRNQIRIIPERINANEFRCIQNR